jgi:hypothetical protein
MSEKTNGVPAAPAPLNREARHATRCKRYDNNCGAVHPSNCPDCQFRTAGIRVPVVVEGRTEEQWCQEACRIGAYDYVEVIEGAKGRWIRTFTGERTPEKVEQSIKALKAQAERYDHAHGVRVDGVTSNG